jgi:hypothetical protein
MQSLQVEILDELIVNGADEIQTLVIGNGQLRAKPVLPVMTLRAQFVRSSSVGQIASKRLRVVKTRTLTLVMKQVQRHVL